MRNLLISGLQFAKRQSKLVLGIGVGLAVGGAGTAVVMASVPDTSGVIHACYKNGLLNSGQVRIIDSPSQNCNGNETALSWSQRGIQLPSTIAGADLSHISLNFYDLSNFNFTNTSFQYANLAGSNLTGANLTQTNLAFTDLSYANLSGQNLTVVNSFGSGNYTKTNFSNADLTGQGFGSGVDNTIFSGANLTSTSFSHPVGASNFTRANFTNASLLGGDFSVADLTAVTWSNTTCPDGTNSDNNGNTCIGHLVP